MKAVQAGSARSRRNRLIGWIVFYLLVLVGFLVFVYSEGRTIPISTLRPGRILLTTNKTSYNAGDTIAYTIQNNLDAPITLVNRCPGEPLHVYEWQNSQWVRVHDTTDVTQCDSPTMTTTIAAHAAYRGSYARYPALFAKPGIYRIVTLATNYTDLPYADFMVVQPTTSQQPATPIIIYQPIYIPVPTGGGDD